MSFSPMKGYKMLSPSIVDADVQLADSKVLKFDLRKNKVFLFNRESEMRLR